MAGPVVKGFSAAGVASGIKPNGDKDLALIVSEVPCNAAGVFTTNRVKAACVVRNYALLFEKRVKPCAVVINSGNANACTGETGQEKDEKMASIAAGHIGAEVDDVLTLSTGVIGVQLPMSTIEMGVGLFEPEPDGWQQAAEAIVTTDTHPKIAIAKSAAGYSIMGIAKGAGMIAPNMATMLSIIVTDAQIGEDTLDQLLKQTSAKTFNRIVVDGDMSTNDTVLLLANGMSGVSPNIGEFSDLLLEVSTELAHAIVKDGEGATKFVTVHVSGAATAADAEAAARSIATSPLCKTAFYGADPNWGRFFVAAGYSGAEFSAEDAVLWLLDKDGGKAIKLVEDGVPSDYDEPDAISLMEGDEWGIHIDLGAGQFETTVWTCDLSHDYVSINGHYRT